MRFSHTIFLVSGVILCSAAAMPLQQEKLAEEQFKNITSFKGNKASEVLPAMEFMSASLKVDCDYCHTQDRSSDEKEEKKVAREMIAMQRDINAKHFGGRNQVTCATCHGGRTNPLSVPPVEGINDRARRNPEVKPVDVLAAYGKAVGTSASGFQMEGKSRLYGKDVTLSSTYLDGKYYVVAHLTAGGDIRQGYNGSAAWFAQPGGQPFPLPAEVATKFVRDNMLPLGPGSLPTLTSPSGGSAKIGTRDMNVVSGTIAGEKGRASYYFDAKTGLLARTMFSYPTILGSNVQINDYTNYKKVGGVQIPMVVANHTGDQDAVKVYSSAKASSKIDSAIFNPSK